VVGLTLLEEQEAVIDEVLEFTLWVRCFCSWAKTPPSFRVTKDKSVVIGSVDPRTLSTYEHYNTVEKIWR
jgi:hypothetical protein